MNNQLSVDVKTNIEKDLPQIIEFNFEPLKAGLSEALEKYQGVVVTQETIKDAKDTRAELNRFKKSLNDTRIAYTKAWNKPAEVFKGKMDELIGMVDECSAAIDRQIKAFDDAEREEKRAAIAAFYTNNVKELKDILPLERIWDDKWLNKGTKPVDATTQLYDRIEAVRKDLKTIDTMEIAHKDYLHSAYLQTLNIGAALDARRKYENEQKALKKREPQVSETEPDPAPAPLAEFPPDVATMPPPIPETLCDLELRFIGTTKAFRQDFKALCVKHGLVYKKDYFGGIVNGDQ